MRNQMMMAGMVLTLAMVGLVGCSEETSGVAEVHRPVSLSLYQGDSAGRILLSPTANQPALTSSADQYDDVLDRNLWGEGEE